MLQYIYEPKLYGIYGETDTKQKTGRIFIMNENENLVAEATENVEHTTEETPAKTYTQEEVNAMMGKRLARQEARIKKDYERKQRESDDLIETLKAGTGKQTVPELNDAFMDFYTKNVKGFKVNKKPDYSDRDIETLARADANEIIQGGYDEVVEEVDRLANTENLSPRDREVFRILAEHRQNTERSNELAKIGITEDVYNSKEFQDYKGMFKDDTPITKVWNEYQKSQPKKEFKTMGSMKNTASADNGIKDFYTPEEARRFTKKDFDDNPALFKAVENSMKQWKK